MRRTWRKWSGHHSLRGHCESRIASRLDVATKEAAEAAAEAAEAAVSINTVNHFAHNFIGDKHSLVFTYVILFVINLFLCGNIFCLFLF